MRPWMKAIWQSSEAFADFENFLASKTKALTSEALSCLLTEKTKEATLAAVELKFYSDLKDSFDRGIVEMRKQHERTNS